jgi:hypothetical protein
MRPHYRRSLPTPDNDRYAALHFVKICVTKAYYLSHFWLKTNKLPDEQMPLAGD